MTKPNYLDGRTRQHLLDVREQLEDLEKLALAAGWLKSQERLSEITKRVNLVLLVTMPREPKR